MQKYSDNNMIPSVYDHIPVEKRWLEVWNERDVFKRKIDTEKLPYSIILPPPNITGALTIGHVLNATIQDILIRWKKMSGYSTYWIPGMDHAGIATESKVIKSILQENKSLSIKDIDKKFLINEINEWANKYKIIIKEQYQKLGCSCDWSSERFTLDDDYKKAVQKVFIDLYNEGYIYRGHRIVNWCPASQTALSDEEVIHKKISGKLYYFLYPLSDSTSEYVEIATTRPETMFGDTAVACHPDDKRYNKLIGKMITLPFVDRKIPIIADSTVNINFGTGCVKITPAHDINDFEIGLRHKLEMINVINIDGTMNDICKNFKNIDRFECRTKVVKEMGNKGLLKKIEKYTHNVGHSEKGNVIIETLMSKQWFVNMHKLINPAIDAIKSGEIKFYPKRWEKNYFNWMDNLKDWCISRQISWGHEIPVWYNKETEEIYVGTECPKSNNEIWIKETDVLDTWFSSWIWPFATMGWPKDNEVQEYFYPTDDLVTAPDIIFFWVARMIVASMKYKNIIPFKNVYFTGVVRDLTGKKLSKSLGNSPDPLDVIQNYGADALRLTITYISPTGMDIMYDNDECKLGRNFINKLWNLFRFRKMINSEIVWKIDDNLDYEIIDDDEKWILHKLNKVIKYVNEYLNNFEFNKAIKELYNFTKTIFCNKFVENFKIKYDLEEDKSKKKLLLKTFDFIMYNLIKLLHPFIPFITEDIFNKMCFCDKNSLISDSGYTGLETIKLTLSDEQENIIDLKYKIISICRQLRKDNNILSESIYDISIKNNNIKNLIKKQIDIIEKYVNAKKINIINFNYIDMIQNKNEFMSPLINIRIIPFDKKKYDLTSDKNKIRKNLEVIKKLESRQTVIKNRYLIKNEIADKNELREAYKEYQDLLFIKRCNYKSYINYENKVFSRSEYEGEIYRFKLINDAIDDEFYTYQYYKSSGKIINSGYSGWMIKEIIQDEYIYDNIYNEHYKLKLEEFNKKNVLIKRIYKNEKFDTTKELLEYEYDDFYEEYNILTCINKLDNEKNVLTKYIYKNRKSDITEEYDKEGKIIYSLKYIYDDYNNLKRIDGYYINGKQIISYDY